MFNTLCAVGNLVFCSVMVQALCAECAALFNESIIREIITGRYLNPARSVIERADGIGVWDLHENATGCW